MDELRMTRVGRSDGISHIRRPLRDTSRRNFFRCPEQGMSRLNLREIDEPGHHKLKRSSRFNCAQDEAAVIPVRLPRDWGFFLFVGSNELSPTATRCYDHKSATVPRVHRPGDSLRVPLFKPGSGDYRSRSPGSYPPKHYRGFF